MSLKLVPISPVRILPSLISSKIADETEIKLNFLRKRCEMDECSGSLYTFEKMVVAGGYRFEARQMNQLMSFLTVLNLLESGDQKFTSAFLDILRSVPFKAYFFETPPMTEAKVLRKLILTQNSLFLYPLIAIKDSTKIFCTIEQGILALNPLSICSVMNISLLKVN